jgi:hypothetical protein
MSVHVNIGFKLLMQKEQERAFGSNPTAADNYGHKTGCNKAEGTGDNDGQGATLTEKKIN